MMKKLMVLMLVLGLATVANAHFIFTVNGSAQPAEITLSPTAGGQYPKTAELDLDLSADEKIFSYQLDYVLSNDKAELITNGASRTDLGTLTDIAFPTVFEFPGSLMVNLPQKVGIAAGQFIGNSYRHNFNWPDYWL
jgi:hypothetical protein